MVQPLVDPRALNQEHIAGIFNNTDETAVACWVGANSTRIRLGNATTLRAEDDFLFNLHDGARQALGTHCWRAQDKKLQSLRGLLTNARQTAEFLNKIIQGTWSGH